MKKLLAICSALFILNRSFGVDHPWHYSKLVIEGGTAYELTQWKLVDRGWRPRVNPGGHWRGDFYPFNEHFDKWVILSTNAVTRPISVIARSKFQDKIDEMEPGYKKQKALEKAAIKFGKNLDKERKNWEKLRDKAATQEEREFWQTLLDVLPVPNDN